MVTADHQRPAPIPAAGVPPNWGLRRRSNSQTSPILPPQIGSFSPLARVVAGFLAFYFFHNVAMHPKSDALH
jgi:hypothetical protein